MDPEGAIRRLALLPLGTPPLPVLRRIAQRLSRIVELPCRLGAGTTPFPIPMLEGRGQGDADAMLAMLEELAAHEEVLVGATSIDIGHPIFTYFFGRARRGSNALVVSLARLTPTFYGLPADPDLFVERAALEILHELGHVTGLPHCVDYACIMRFAPTVEAIDVRGKWFCPACLETFRTRIPERRPSGYRERHAHEHGHGD